MTTPDFIIALFYAVDQEMLEVSKYPDAKLYGCNSYIDTRSFICVW